ncbi:peroxisome biogenesis factor 10 [Serendipita sp. 399]|nr:peroxisome biogenesis factor 10 [Serendipita sp. 399]
MTEPQLSVPQFPAGSQAQIVRSSQRDAVFVAQLKEDIENVLRNWFARLRNSDAVSLRASPALHGLLSVAPQVLTFAYTLNLAIFYLRGTYYTLSLRVLRTGYITTVPPNPNARPPSYAFLGVLLLSRMVHKAYYSVSVAFQEAGKRIEQSEKARGKLPEPDDSTHMLMSPVNNGALYLDYTSAEEILSKQRNEEDADPGTTKIH